MSKIKDYAVFIKLRLSLLVVFSAGMGFLYATENTIDWQKFTLLIISGFLVTGSSNGLNQLFEKNSDKLMSRTSDRPLPGERMSSNEGLYLSAFLGMIGITTLTIFINPLSGLLGAAALISYAFVYTPLKKITPFAVFIGAFPGAIPPLLGYVAVTNKIDLDALLLYSIQFIWQFPHFWAVAWVLDDDYKKAGFKMLPSGQRDTSSAFQTLVYTIGLLPIALLPYFFSKINVISAIIICFATIVFIIQSYNLLKKQTINTAKHLMFGSFVYLPTVQIALVLGKL